MKNIAIRPGSLGDIPDLAHVQNSAARAFLILPDYKLTGRTVPVDILTHAVTDGQLWVATDHDIPVGFIVCRDMDQSLYIHEISVAHDFQQQGIGSRLMKVALDYAANMKYPSIILTTRRDVVWNMPFYISLGFSEITNPEEWPDIHEQILRDIKNGSDPLIRCAMIKHL